MPSPLWSTWGQQCAPQDEASLTAGAKQQKEEKRGSRAWWKDRNLAYQTHVGLLWLCVVSV